MTENNSAAITWFKVAWPVVVFVLGAAMAALGQINQVQTKIAVLQAQADNRQQTLNEIKTDLKEIKQILMNPVR